MIDFDQSANINIGHILAPANHGLLCVRAQNRPSALVFVHGFWSGTIKTWGLRDHVFWPFEIGKEVGSDVYCYQYNNHPIGGGSENPLRFDVVASNLADGVLSLQRYERLIFVTHSFGGIVVQQLLSTLLRADPAHRELALRTFGLCAFSCPNRGHWLASLFASGHRFASSNAKVLRWNSNELLEVQSRFAADKAALKNLHVRTIGENGFLYNFFRIPHEQSKIPDGEHTVSSLNHAQICSNLRPRQIEYRWVRDFAERCNRATDARIATLGTFPGFLGPIGKS